MDDKLEFVTGWSINVNGVPFNWVKQCICEYIQGSFSTTITRCNINCCVKFCFTQLSLWHDMSQSQLNYKCYGGKGFTKKVVLLGLWGIDSNLWKEKFVRQYVSNCKYNSCAISFWHISKIIWISSLMFNRRLYVDRNIGTKWRTSVSI